MLNIRSLFPRTRVCHGHADAKELCQHIEQHLEHASGERMLRLARSIRNLQDDWQATAESDIAFISEIARLRLAVRTTRAGYSNPTPREKRLHYVVSTLFPEDDCFRYLTSDPARREIMHLVTGPVTLDGVRVLSRVEKVSLQQQSDTYVKADPLAIHKQLIALTECHGHQPLAWFHNHPGNGVESTQPSEIDLATQDRLSGIGWDVVAGIFSLDGVVRFFSTTQDFEIAIYGNGAKVISAMPRETIIQLAVES
jgi:hypothetical protein